METPLKYHNLDFPHTPMKFYSNEDSSDKNRKRQLFFSISRKSDEFSNEFLENAIYNANFKGNVGEEAYEVSPSAYMNKTSPMQKNSSQKGVPMQDDKDDMSTLHFNSNTIKVKKNLFNILVNQIGKKSSPRKRRKVSKPPTIIRRRIDVFKVKNRNKQIPKSVRIKKTPYQLLVLKTYYNEIVSNKTQFNRKQIKKISMKINLDVNKIYKWLWDKKNKLERKNLFIVTKYK